jgi:hypothetical protein
MIEVVVTETGIVAVAPPSPLTVIVHNPAEIGVTVSLFPEILGVAIVAHPLTVKTLELFGCESVSD